MKQALVKYFQVLLQSNAAIAILVIRFNANAGGNLEVDRSKWPLLMRLVSEVIKGLDIVKCF